MYSRIIFIISKFFYFFSFKGSTRVLQIIAKRLPLKHMTVVHPLGFLWFLDSRSSLSTYLSSCEKFTTKIVADIASSLDLFVCVGANRGWYPLLVSQSNPNTEIHAYEPNSMTYDRLKKNVELNHAPATLHKLAIGDSARFAEIFGYPDANDGMATIYPTNWFLSKYEKLEQIEMEAIDSEVSNWRMLDGISLIQMDIEGCEYEALLGGRKFLVEHSPMVICEVNPVLLKSANQSPSDLFKYMEQLGYFIYWIDERGGLYSQKAENDCRHIPFLPSGSGSNYIFLKDFHRSKISFKLED